MIDAIHLAIFVAVIAGWIALGCYMTRKRA